MASAAQNALADFARRPTGYKVAVFAGIGALLGLLYWQFALSPLRTERSELEATQQDLTSQSARLDREMVEYAKLSERSSQLRAMIEQNQKALPTGAELPAFFETLNRKVGEAGVEVKKWEYKREVPVEAFIKVPLEIELTGTFYQVKRFFSSLVPRDELPAIEGAPPPERERIITIENLSLTVPTGKSRDLLLTATFTASTFRQEGTENDDLLFPPGGGAQTPGGVKAKVDGSMQKSQQRVQGSPGGGI
jgi:type IV pilus assembly protein PilO